MSIPLSGPAPTPALRFEDLTLIDQLLQQVKAQGYEIPTPIQAQAIPVALKGQDVLGCAQTGTGKTAAFALPILQRLFQTPKTHRKPRVLVVAPTRELVLQIRNNFLDYGKKLPFKSAAIFGGVSYYHQIEALRQGPQIIIATPGRLLDLITQRYIQLSDIEVLVLDEADRMLDMGFLPDVRRILTFVPKERQTLFFSATMPPEIAHLVKQIQKNPVHISVTPISSTVGKIDQSVFYVQKQNKKSLLAHVLESSDVKRALVFTRTKRDANRVALFLASHRIRTEAIHGEKSQGARQRALESFRCGQVRVLVATDIASRGIDVDDITHVINLDVPDAPENYVHRIGRTGRAGRSGSAFSFCSPDERGSLKGIERLINKRLSVVDKHPYLG